MSSESETRVVYVVLDRAHAIILYGTTTDRVEAMALWREALTTIPKNTAVIEEYAVSREGHMRLVRTYDEKRPLLSPLGDEERKAIASREERVFAHTKDAAFC